MIRDAPLQMVVETQHKEGGPGTDDNALQLNAKTLKKRQTEVVDIVEGKLSADSASKYGDGDPKVYR